jgi:hypothetical protein
MFYWVATHGNPLNCGSGRGSLIVLSTNVPSALNMTVIVSHQGRYRCAYLSRAGFDAAIASSL